MERFTRVYNLLGNKVWFIISMILFGVGLIFQKMYQIPFIFDSIFFSVSYKYYMFGSVSLIVFLYNMIMNYVNVWRNTKVVL